MLAEQNDCYIVFEKKSTTVKQYIFVCTNFRGSV